MAKTTFFFYLKLLCESIDHEGMLRFSEQIPYNEKMLATITNTNVDIVRSATKIFAELGMMDMLDDGTIYMNEVNKMLGSETYWAEKKRIQRDNEKALLLDNVQQMSNDSPTCPSKRKSIEIEKETEKENRDRVHYQQIADLYNEICISFPRITSLSDARKKAIKARLKTYSIDDFKLMFQKAEESDFLKGKNARNWSANFDWMIKDANFAKILDDNYQPKSNDTLEQSYKMMSQWAMEE